ncbi:MAG: GIY-YIG nuclease family protein [Chloroflexota bacterium]
MRWKKMEWVEKLAGAFGLHMLLAAAYVFGYLPDVVYKLSDSNRYLWFAVVPTFLVLFQDVLNIIWDSAKYRKSIAKKRKLAAMLRMKPLVKTKKKDEADGYIYLLRREKDGVCKIGMTINLKSRLPSLVDEYGELEPVAYWQVSDRRECEKIALKMTRAYFHKEGGRRELRKMTWIETHRFVSEFSACLLENYEELVPQRRSK